MGRGDERWLNDSRKSQSEAGRTCLQRIVPGQVKFESNLLSDFSAFASPISDPPKPLDLRPPPLPLESIMQVKLVSSDNESFTVDKEVAERSVLIKNMLEGKPFVHHRAPASFSRFQSRP